MLGLLRRLDRNPDPRLDRALARAEASGAALVFITRSAALAVIGVWLWVSVADTSRLFYMSFIAAFLILGLIARLAHRLSRDPFALQCAVILVDALLLTWVMVEPSPGAGPGWTAQLNLRFSNFIYFFVYLAGITLTYSPARMAWAGICVALAWSAASWWLMLQPETLVTADQLVPPAATAAEVVARLVLAPTFVSPVTWATQVIVFLLTTTVLALAVARSRRLLAARLAAEAGRANLARYFPPEVSERLARDPSGLNVVRRQRVVVVFMDIVGFTGIAERAGPEATMALLRDHHARVARVVFAHGGALEKFIGDAVKVTFGAPEPQPDDCARAYACVQALVAEMARWSAERTAAGLEPLAVGVGVHVGEAAVGNIGDGRALEYTVIGDTVNVASRLERLTRRLGAVVVASAEFLEATPEPVRAGDVWEDAGTTPLRGRGDPLALRRWSPPGAARPAVPPPAAAAEPVALRAHEV